MNCRYLDCTAPVAAPGMSRCAEHRMRWSPGAPVEPEPRLPEWRRRAAAKPHGLARPLDRSAA